MTLSFTAGLAIDWTCVIITILFVGLRLYVRVWLQRSPSVSDACLLLALSCFIFLACSNTFTKRYHEWGWNISTGTAEAAILITKGKLIPVLKLLYTCGPVYYTALWSVKAAFLLFYYQIIPRALSRIRCALHITSLFVAVSGLVVMSMNIFWCFPISRNWALDDSFCSTFSVFPPYFVGMACHFASDIMIFTLPFPLLQHLNLSPRKKIGVAAMFALGSLCILASVGRAVSIGTAFSQASVDAMVSLEQSTAIVVACCPPLKWLYHSRRYYPNGAPCSDKRDDEWGTWRRGGTVDVEGGGTVVSLNIARHWTTPDGEDVNAWTMKAPLASAVTENSGNLGRTGLRTDWEPR